MKYQDCRTLEQNFESKKIIDGFEDAELEEWVVTETDGHEVRCVSILHLNGTNAYSQNYLCE